MKFLILAIFVAITAFLIWRSKQNTDPTEQACAIEIGNLLKANPDAKPQAIADVFMEHGIDPSRCGNPPEKQRCLKVEFSVSY
ncbi:MAG: hypothetical protein GYB26_14775, partial [Gammaproteobacteria bacterium]|nr:hypothetical protein [Gammaproteobacteria bacterium]